MAAGPNKSVERLKRVLASLTAPAKTAIKAELWDAARFIADEMRLAAARGKTGNLQASVRVEQGRREFSVVIKAGGPLTTKPVRSGQTATYDYALANEFGTRAGRENPFFWNSYNANKKAAKNRVRKAGKKAIEEQARRDGFIVS
jgi:HK97 gp10 family phage protein